MKKVLIFMLSAMFLTGCTAAPAATAAPAEPSTTSTAEPAAETAVPEEPEETVEAEPEEELQMIEGVFTKDLDYTGEEKLKAGDEIILYYTGSFEEGRLTAVKVEKK